MAEAAFLQLPADLRARLRTLRLLPRFASGSRGIGQHASRSRGAGLEFAQYRAYEPGDELRQIDWKLYARSDRFFVRESERESPITVWLLLDATASAGQCDQQRPGYSRLQHMQVLTACVVQLALQQGDSFGLLAVDGQGLQLVPPGQGPRQRDRVHLQLQALHARGGWPAAATLRPLWERVRAGDLLLYLGDGFDDGAIALLQQLASARREVAMLQVLGADEREFPFNAGHRFRDPETGEELLGDGASIRADYLQRFADARAALQAQLHSSGIASTTAWLDQPPDEALRALFHSGGQPMTLLFPLGLLALGALLVPLLIHLARRTPYTPLDFAALRWLRAQQRPRQRIRFDDWPLLLVRLLLLAALAVLLARPAMTGPEPVAPAWTVVVPGLDAQALRDNDDAKHWHWLAPGFPPIEEAAPAATASVPSLLRELDAQLPADTVLTAYVPDPLTDLDGARLQLSRPLQWHPVAVTPEQTEAGRAAPQLRPAATTSAATLHWLAALQQAWSQQPLAATLTAEAVPEQGEIGVWASKEPLSAQWQTWLQHGGTLLTATPAPQQAQVVLRDAQGAPLLLQQRDGQGRLLHLLGEWDASSNAALRDPGLPRHLLLALQGEPMARLGDAQDHTPMLTQLPMPQPAPRELAPWLIGLILLLFALERWMASAPRRRQPA